MIKHTKKLNILFIITIFILTLGLSKISYAFTYSPVHNFKMMAKNINDQGSSTWLKHDVNLSFDIFNKHVIIQSKYAYVARDGNQVIFIVLFGKSNIFYEKQVKVVKNAVIRFNYNNRGGLFIQSQSIGTV